MLEVEARRYTAEQVARWKAHPHAAYADDGSIGEEPNATHRTRIDGPMWMPQGPPEAAYWMRATDGDVNQVTVALDDGRAVFGCGAGSFTWKNVAVLDEDGSLLWSRPIDLGMKRGDDVWVVTIADERAPSES